MNKTWKWLPRVYSRKSNPKALEEHNTYVPFQDYMVLVQMVRAYCNGKISLAELNSSIRLTEDKAKSLGFPT